MPASGRRCLECRTKADRRGCRGFEWYSIPEIKFCWAQCKWLLEHLEEIKVGEWPTESVETGYIDRPARGRYQTGAYFERSCQIAAEVEVRLEATGKAGQLLYAQIKAELSLTLEAREALAYIVGWRRKRMAFNDWRRKVKERQALG